MTSQHRRREGVVPNYECGQRNNYARSCSREVPASWLRINYEALQPGRRKCKREQESLANRDSEKHSRRKQEHSRLLWWEKCSQKRAFGNWRGDGRNGGVVGHDERSARRYGKRAEGIEIGRGEECRRKERIGRELIQRSLVRRTIGSDESEHLKEDGTEKKKRRAAISA